MTLLEEINQIEKSQKFAEVIAEKITSLIQSGKLKPGERLPTENELCEAFGVGRSSVREALRALEHVGFIKSRQGVGRFVAEDVLSLDVRFDWNKVLSSAPIAELMEARKHGEVLAARLAAERACDDDLSRIEVALDKVRQHASNEELYFQDELDLHLTIARTCKNTVIYEFVRTLIDKTYGHAEKFMKTIVSTSNASIGLFEQLLQALKDGDSEKAGELMYQHLEVVEEVLRRK